MTESAAVDRLARGQYVSLITYKRDGTAIPTPVWVSREGDRLYVWTQADSGKVKRIRNRAHVQVAPCDMRGQLEGEPVDASARILDAPAEIERVERLHKGKYGATFQLFQLGGRIFRRGRAYAAIEITVP